MTFLSACRFFILILVLKLRVFRIVRPPHDAPIFSSPVFLTRQDSPQEKSFGDVKSLQQHHNVDNYVP
jgi:hypothetical protein